MERRYELRLEQMLAQAEVSPELMQGLLKRLDAFAEPFAKSLAEPEQRRHAAEYMASLLSKLERKTGETIAYLHDHECEGLQKFVGHVAWDHKLRQLIAGLIAKHFDTNAPSSLCLRATRWLRRNEQARLYHHRSRKVMPRLKNQLRL